MRGAVMSKKYTAGASVPKDTYNRLSWLAYMHNTTVSKVLAGYIERGMAEEDFSNYQPPNEE